jgi:hypothetical protein
MLTSVELPKARAQGACRPVEHPGRHFKPPICLRLFQRAAEDHKTILGDGTMNANSANKPRMMPTKNLPKNVPGRSQSSWYNVTRIHLSLKHAPISRAAENAECIICRPVMDGLHHQYGPM